MLKDTNAKSNVVQLAHLIARKIHIYWAESGNRVIHPPAMATKWAGMKVENTIG
jgi:hypothetical protein